VNSIIDAANQPFSKKDRIFASHQPNYFPWLGYFYKIYQSDIFVFADDLQYSNEGMQNYCYIKTSQGPFRLKIPVHQTLGDKINEVRTKDELGWKQKHIKAIELNYRKAKKFNEFFDDYLQLIGKEYPSLIMMNITIIKFIAEKLGIEREYTSTSELGVNGIKEERVLQMCQALNATIYYSGTGANVYQTKGHFKAISVELRYSKYTPFNYPQLWAGFQSNVSIIDFLMNCGYDWDLVIRNQKENLKK
jgi:transcriptional regulator with XRE-family HTH domain